MSSDSEGLAEEGSKVARAVRRRPFPTFNKHFVNRFSSAMLAGRKRRVLVGDGVNEAMSAVWALTLHDICRHAATRKYRAMDAKGLAWCVK